MDFETLLKQLEHPKPSVRIAALHILNMVDEVRALDAISARVPMEMDAKVDVILKQVGRTLNKLKREGYDTIVALCQHFNVYSDVLSHADAAEITKIQRMTQISSDNRKEGNLDDAVMNAAAVLITARLLGPTAAMSAMTPKVDISSNMGSVTETMQKLSKRVRPTRPTEEDFSRWLPRLKAEDPQERRQMLIQISNCHNPMALQYFAQVWVMDTDVTVRETAKRLGKMLYWNVVYSQMEDDGSLAQLMQDYADSLGIKLTTKLSTQEINIAHQQSIDDILKAAEERRSKKRK